MLLKAETAHTRIVVNAHEIIERRKLTDWPFLFCGKKLFASVKQQSSPTVWQSIAEAAKDVSARLGCIADQDRC